MSFEHISFSLPSIYVFSFFRSVESVIFLLIEKHAKLQIKKEEKKTGQWRILASRWYFAL